MVLKLKIHCPFQVSGPLNLDTCDNCKYCEKYRGDHASTNCRKNNSDPRTKVAFETLYIGTAYGITHDEAIILDD